MAAQRAPKAGIGATLSVANKCPAQSSRRFMNKSKLTTNGRLATRLWDSAYGFINVVVSIALAYVCDPANPAN